MCRIDKIRINGIGFFICAMFYVYISIIIFLIGWIKAIISIPVTIVLLIALYKYYKSYKPNIENVEPIYISMKMFFALFIIVCAIACILGWTGFAKQTGDFIKHNSVLQDLTNKSWPVYYNNTGQTSMLTYYIGQYLFPALIGKIFSSQYLTIFINCIWYMFGLFIAILGIFKITKADKTSKQIIALITFLFFSVCLILSQTLGKPIIENYPKRKL